MGFFHCRDRDFKVFVKKDQYGQTEKPCDWLGQDTYKCGNCRKGYPKVKRNYEMDDFCPECGWLVFTRYSED